MGVHGIMGSVGRGEAKFRGSMGGGGGVGGGGGGEGGGGVGRGGGCTGRRNRRCLVVVVVAVVAPATYRRTTEMHKQRLSKNPLTCGHADDMCFSSWRAPSGQLLILCAVFVCVLF